MNDFPLNRQQGPLANWFPTFFRICRTACNRSNSESTGLCSGSRHRLFAVSVVLVAVLGASGWYSAAESPAERDAREFISLHAFTQESYTHSLASELILISGLQPSGRKPLLSRRRVGFGFSRDRMTDAMATHLLNIRELDAITLYPPDWAGVGCDFNATVFTKVQSLRGSDIPACETSIRMLESRFPNLIIHLADLPSED
jgi:hypothetical protein